MTGLILKIIHSQTKLTSIAYQLHHKSFCINCSKQNPPKKQKKIKWSWKHRLFSVIFQRRRPEWTQCAPPPHQKNIIIIIKYREIVIKVDVKFPAGSTGTRHYRWTSYVAEFWNNKLEFFQFPSTAIANGNTIRIGI